MLMHHACMNIYIASASDHAYICMITSYMIHTNNVKVFMRITMQAVKTLYLGLGIILCDMHIVIVK